MNKSPLPSAITTAETRAGLALFVLHVIVLPLGLAAADSALALGLTETMINVIYYAVSFALTLALMGRYLKREFYALTENIFGTIAGVFVGYIILTALSNILFYLILLVTEVEGVNPNDEAVAAVAKSDSGAMIAAAVLLGPIVEEVIFRGVIFGSLRKRNRAAAYIVSFLVFAVYHLWQYAIIDPDPWLLLNVLDYLPASLALAWAYERSRNLWSPIILHAVVNLISISYYINL